MSRENAGNPSLVGEHPLADTGQVILGCALLTGLMLDRLILHWSAGLALTLPLAIRGALAAPLLWAGVTLGLRAHAVLFEGHDTEPRLMTGGVFAYVRHPLYAGELMALLALTILSASGVAMGVWLLLALFIRYIARHEEKLLRARFAEQYAEYSRRVPMLLPSLRPRTGAGRTKANQNQS